MFSTPCGVCEHTPSPVWRFAPLGEFAIRFFLGGAGAISQKGAFRAMRAYWSRRRGGRNSPNKRAYWSRRRGGGNSPTEKSVWHASALSRACHSFFLSKSKWRFLPKNAFVLVRGIWRGKSRENILKKFATCRDKKLNCY